MPSKGQFIGETAYFFIRNGIARDMIGHDFRRYLPFLIALFSFILVNNLWGIFPLTLIPTASHVGWAYGLALHGLGALQRGRHRQARVRWLPETHHAARPGCRRRCGRSSSRWSSSPTSSCGPITLSLRLFANMFAGHLLVLVFVLGGEFLLLHTDSIVNKLAGVVAWIFSMAIFGLEVFVQSLQAFIFTVLTANYIASATAEEH